MRTGYRLIRLTFVVAAAALGQIQGISPEVHPDRTVTFRLRAPQATQVIVRGDWPETQLPALSKGPNGVWSLTTQPLEATVHSYFFIVDGIAIIDPVNPKIRHRQDGAQSLVEVPASPAAPWTLTHGAVVTELRNSPILGRAERIYVYLPPGYTGATRRYPVLYLIHGSNDVPDAWSTTGAANLILDNLIASKNALPMIVVMPAGHAALPGPPPVPFVDNSDLFDSYLTKEVIPFIESAYRTAPGSANRALAGLSMGAGLTLTTGLSHQDLFSALGMFSASVLDPLMASYKTVLDDPQGLNARLPIIWSGCGDRDPQCTNMKQFTDVMQQHGIPATLRTIEGGAHAWPVWRLCLSEFVPLLFRGKP